MALIASVDPQLLTTNTTPLRHNFYTESHWNQVLFPDDLELVSGREYTLELVMALGTSAWWVKMREEGRELARGS